MELTNFQIIIQLFLAAILGGLIGVEREYKRKEAGIRTYSLVCLGAAFFTLVSFEIYKLYSSQEGISFDPARMISQIVLGIGFLGAGLIVLRDSHIEGLTTAAGLWVTAAVGAAIGAKFYLPAVFVTFLAIAILAGPRLVEEKLFKRDQ